MFIILNELLIIDGQPGCGKTLLSAIVSAFSRVELLQFSTIAENICALNYLEKIEYVVGGSNRVIPLTWGWEQTCPRIIRG